MTFRQRTTFVIGAGASAEFGLPVGSQLATRIKKNTRTTLGSNGRLAFDNLWIGDVFRDVFLGKESDSRAVEALNIINESIHTAVSIDALVHRFRSNEYVARVAKVLIAAEILKAERESTLGRWEQFHVDPDYELESDGASFINPDRTWIGQFFRILTDNVEDPCEIGKEVDIICFNYDRCIEYYLAKSIEVAYRVSFNVALEIVEKINIIHPYGSLGKLTYAGIDYGDDRIAFGHPLDGPIDVEEISKNIRTYTEQIRDLRNVKAIHDAISNCRVLVFLGFGFNNQNMNLLRVLPSNNVPTSIFVSGLGFSPQVETTLMRRIAELLSLGLVHLNRGNISAKIEFGVSAAELFSIHSPNLSQFGRMYIYEQTGEFSSVEYED